MSLYLAAALPIAVTVGVGVLGVVMAHYPMIFSGFARIQTDLGDTRLIHYLLEHGYLWVCRVPGHLTFWDPPFFYPAPNAAAYSDALVSVGPVYWLCRASGASPDLSFGLWMVSMSVLNYLAGLLLFRKGLGFGMPAAVAGAALVAFGAPRLNQMNHQQLLPFFYPLLSLFALARVFGDRSLSRRVRAGYWLLAMAGMVAQLYAAVYPALFLIVGLEVTAVAALVMPSSRRVMLEVVKRDVWAIAPAGVAGAVLLEPFVAHYLPAAREVGPQFITTLRALHPRLGSWLDLGPGHWLWGWACQPGWSREYAHIETEHHLGIGFLTPFACVAGLYLGRARPLCRLAAVSAFIMWLATTYIPGDWFALLATAVSFYCAAGLFLDGDEPAWRGLGLFIVVFLLLVIPFPNRCLTALGLNTMVLCFLEIARLRESPRALIVPGIALAALTVKFFSLEPTLRSILIVAPPGAMLAYYGRPWRREIALASLAFLLLFLLSLTFYYKQLLVFCAFVGLAVSLAVSARRWHRPPAWVLVKVMVVALAIVLIFYHHDSLWLDYSRLIPGAVAIRAIGRVVLILLIPAALGLACLVEFLEQRRRAIAGWIVVLACLAEQGVTTPSFDAAANRASIETLANRVDRSQRTFYYHPDDDRPFSEHHLDAMWASLASGVPTVNGYSGHAPRRWHGFFNADFDRSIDIKEVLAEWEQTYSLTPDQVQWIGADRFVLAGTETGRAGRASSPSAVPSGNMAVRNDDPRPHNTNEAGTRNIQGTTR